VDCVPVGQRGVTIQPSLRDSGIIDLESQPSDKSLGYCQPSLRDEQPGMPACGKYHQTTVELNRFAVGVNAPAPTALLTNYSGFSDLAGQRAMMEELGTLIPTDLHS